MFLVIIHSGCPMVIVSLLFVLTPPLTPVTFCTRRVLTLAAPSKSSVTCRPTPAAGTKDWAKGNSPPRAASAVHVRAIAPPQMLYLASATLVLLAWFRCDVGWATKRKLLFFKHLSLNTIYSLNTAENMPRDMMACLLYYCSVCLQ